MKNIQTLWQRLSVEKLTLFAVLIFGAFYLFVFPPNSAPDEAVHFAAAYQNADAMLGQTSPDTNSVAVRKADAKMFSDYSNFPDKHTYEFFRGELFKPLPADGTEIIDVPRMSGVPYPYIYIPQTIGVLIGRAFHANPEWLYLFGRILNLILYAVCAWLAVKLAPIGKGVFAVAALFPMAMELAASQNSDTFTIALSFIALAQYLRIVYTDGPAGTRDLWLLLLTMLAMGPPKVVFFPFLLLLLFLPGKCFLTKRLAVIFRILVVVLSIIVLGLTLYAYAHRADGGAPVVSFMDQEIYSFSDLASDPILFAKMCKRTIEMFFAFYLFSMVGTDLGWLEIRIPDVIIWIFFALAVLGTFREKAAEAALRLHDRLQFIIIFLLAAFGTALIMFVSWTPVGSWNIVGIQGRYFLPICPMILMFATRWRNIPPRPKWLSDKNLVLYACILEVIVLVCVHTFIAGRESVVS
jgi:uncharacterized membrane protein